MLLSARDSTLTINLTVGKSEREDIGVYWGSVVDLAFNLLGPEVYAMFTKKLKGVHTHRDTLSPSLSPSMSLLSLAILLFHTTHFRKQRPRRSKKCVLLRRLGRHVSGGVTVWTAIAQQVRYARSVDTASSHLSRVRYLRHAFRGIYGPGNEARAGARRTMDSFPVHFRSSCEFQVSSRSSAHGVYKIIES